MRKTIKSLVALALALVMCLIMAPATTAKADEAVALSEYTEEQLLTAFMGEWFSEEGEYATLTENHIKVWFNRTGLFEYVAADTDCTYEGLVELEERYTAVDGLTAYWTEGAEEPAKTATKALKFAGGGYTFYVYTNNMWMPGDYVESYLVIEYDNGTEEGTGRAWVNCKDVPYAYMVRVDDVLKRALENNPYAQKFVATPMADTDAEISDTYWDHEYDSIFDEQSSKYIDSPIGQSVEISYADDTWEYHYMYATLTEEGYLVEYEVYKYADTDGDGYDDKQVLKSGTYYFGGVAEPKAEEPTPAPTETPVEEPKTEEPVEEPAEEPAEEPVEEPVEEPAEELVEEPAEEPVEEPKEDTTAEAETPAVETEDNKNVIEKTKDGRDVYTGEQIYIVQKKDCLWTIAKKLLGSGKRYNELFTRNNGVVEKATLIFPGQEIIVPAK